MQYNFTMRIFAQRLREIRLENGYTVQGLAHATGINASSISRWENGAQDITGDKLIILCKHLKVSAGYLLGLED